MSFCEGHCQVILPIVVLTLVINQTLSKFLGVVMITIHMNDVSHQVSLHVALLSSAKDVSASVPSFRGPNATLRASLLRESISLTMTNQINHWSVLLGASRLMPNLILSWRFAIID